MDRVAIVTGGGSGVGRACAVALSEDGWSVVVTGRTDPADGFRAFRGERRPAPTWKRRPPAWPAGPGGGVEG